MPSFQLYITPRANAVVVRWRELRGFRRKGEAINDLLERIDLDAASFSPNSEPAKQENAHTTSSNSNEHCIYASPASHKRAAAQEKA